MFDSIPKFFIWAKEQKSVRPPNHLDDKNRGLDRPIFYCCVDIQ